MCNGKGWDIAFYSDDDYDEITVDQHFCRVFDDCGHVDNTLEEAAREVAKYYREKANCYEENDIRYHYLRQSVMWENFTHPSYLYYKGEESLEGDPL
jgi:N-acetylneuraminic acid mutarotase